MNELQQKYLEKRNTKELVIFKYQLSATCYQLCIRGNSQGRELQLHPLILPLQADSQLMQNDRAYCTQWHNFAAAENMCLRL